MNAWAKNDAVAAANWLGQLPAGPSRDAAITAFTSRIGGADPAAAVQWAATIGDEALRGVQTEAVALDWLQVDPDTATEWIQRSNLPASIKVHLVPQG